MGFQVGMRLGVWVLWACLVLVAAAAGKIDEFAAAGKFNGKLLTQVRRENLQEGVKGPLRSLHLRYRDSWKGKSRTFLWSAQSYTNPDGTPAYALVLTEQKPDGKLFTLLAGGSVDITLGDLGEEDPDDRYRVVYKALNAYLRDHKVEQRLRP